MCGIAGYLSLREPASRAVLQAMLRAIGHRGPDRLSGVVAAELAMGAARLAIVDLEGGSQPAMSGDRMVKAVFNGEIFNYRDLQQSLQTAGQPLRSRSEIETLLELYLLFGRGFVDRIKGQFAIAIWDGRDHTLNLYRDRFGIRPLFWHQGREAISFASEAKALFAGRFVVPALNREALLQTFRLWTVCGDTSAFDDIFQLPPGHMAVCSSSGVKLERYWHWTPPGTTGVLQLDSDEAYAEAFDYEMRASVDRQRMADVPVGSYLSGGIDSSVLAALLQQIQGQGHLRTYSISFDDKEYDESSAQRLMADTFDFDHTTVNINSADIGKYFPRVVWQTETPLFRTAAVPLFLLSRRVHADGRKVVMTGEGADEILLGYDLFREVTIRRFWNRQPDSVWRGKLFQRLYHYLPQYRNPRYLAMVMDFYRATLADQGDPHYAMAVRWANGEALSGYLSAPLRAEAEAYNPTTSLEQWLPPGYGCASDIDQAQMIELSTLLGNYLLSSQGDRMSMAHGVEGRYPYLDDDFVTFASKLPRSIKLRGLKDKFILRRTFSHLLPDEIVSRPKVAYQAPDLKGFFSNGHCEDYVEALMCKERITSTGLFDAARVEQLMTKGRSFSLSRVGMRDNMAFTLILSTQLLDEIYVRGNLSFQSDVATPSEMHFV